MKYQQLTEGQRYQIALLYGERFSCRDIGLRGGVNKSTVSRELRRNCTPDGYAPNEAQRLSEQRRHGATKRSICQSTIDFVELALRWKWSPEQISAVAKTLGLSVSHEWIYQHVAADKAQGGDLYTHLRQGKRGLRPEAGRYP